MPFAIDIKHDSRHKDWRRLSVVMLQAEPLIQDLPAYIAQFAIDYEMNQDQIAGRVVELFPDLLGSKVGVHVRIVHSRDSNATANRPA